MAPRVHQRFHVPPYAKTDLVYILLKRPKDKYQRPKIMLLNKDTKEMRKGERLGRLPIQVVTFITG